MAPALSTAILALLPSFHRWLCSSQSCNARSPFAPQLRPPINPGHESNGMGMTDQPYSAASEREEIAARVASFKATQEKFKREREEYCATTLRKARHSDTKRHPRQQPPFWS